MKAVTHVAYCISLVAEETGMSDERRATSDQRS